MAGYVFTNPIVKTKILTYERLAWQTNDIWYREYKLFESDYQIRKYLQLQNKKNKDIRNIRCYDINFDLRFCDSRDPLGSCRGCGKSLACNYSTKITWVNGHWYCSYECFCKHNPDKIKKDNEL